MAMDCRRRSQVSGAVVGLLLLIGMTIVGGMSLLAGLLFAILGGLLVYALLVWGLCEGRGGAEEYAALLAADWRAEPFVPTRRVVQPGGEVSEEGPLNPVAPVPPGPPLERVTMARGDEPVRIGAGMQDRPGTTDPLEQKETPMPVNDRSAEGSRDAPQVDDNASEAPARGLPEAEDKLTRIAVSGDSEAQLDAMEPAPQHAPDSAAADMALHAAGAASPTADAEAGAEEDAAGGIVPLDRREAKAATDAGARTEGDDLTRINGIGAISRDWLAENGVTRFSQIAGWSEADITRYSIMMGRAGHRIRSDDWVGQARRLAGEEDGTP